MKRRTRGKVEMVLRVSSSNDTFFFFKALKLLFFRGKNEALSHVFKSLHVSISDAPSSMQGPYCNDSTVNGFCSFDFFFVLFA